MSSILTGEVTDEQQAADLIIKSSQTAFHMLVQTYRRNYASMWYNRNASPAAVIAALGTNAQQMFAIASGTAAFLNGLVSGTITSSIPSGWTLTNNADGSITAIPPPSGTGVHPSG